MSLADGPIIMSIGQSNDETPISTKKADDAIIFTGSKSLSSLIFPYMTRAVLETEASEINVEMKIAAVKELHQLPDFRTNFTLNQDMNSITEAIIKAAIDSGVGRARDGENLRPL